MNFAHKTPNHPLSNFVEMLWCWEGYHVAHEFEHCLPTGTTELVFSLNGGPAEVVGPASEYFKLATSAQVAVLGVHFRPGGGFPFFGCPAGELLNRSIRLEDVWGDKARLVLEQLLAAPSMGVRFAIVEDALIAAAKGRLSSHPAVRFAINALAQVPQEHSLSELADQIGLSSRRFIEVFRDEVGLTPKLYSRVKRFQAVLDYLEGDHEVNWAAVSSQCGYFDQAHFINDFGAFTGFTPTEYMQRRGPNRNHLPLG